jgi:hypothetical protein
MSQFVQRRDIDFLLHEVFDLETLFGAPRYRAHDRESISAMLDSAETLARKHSPHRRSARRERAEIRRAPCRNPI